MATKPKKKKSTTSSVRKKPARKKKKNKSSFKRTFLISILSFTLLLFLGFIYYFVIYKNQDTFILDEKITSYSTKELLDDLSKIKTKEPTEEKKVAKHKSIDSTKVVVKKKMKDTAPFEEKGQKKNQNKKESMVFPRGKKPKLAIIIDDVHTRKQINAIKQLGIKITPSIFPPYVLSKHSNQLAKQVKHSMIHLPMESGSKQFNTQYKTLMTSFSDEKLADRVMELRMLFPHTKYINNHTGSVFTSNYKAMKKLYIALKMEGFIFVDSFTEATSKVHKIANEFGDSYIKRDIFIDNVHTVKSIHKQLQKAVHKAKQKGYAVAIGHPSKITMKALSSAKQILKEVELIYIDEI